MLRSVYFRYERWGDPALISHVLCHLDNWDSSDSLIQPLWFMFVSGACAFVLSLCVVHSFTVFQTVSLQETFGCNINPQIINQEPVWFLWIKNIVASSALKDCIAATHSNIASNGVHHGSLILIYWSTVTHAPLLVPVSLAARLMDRRALLSGAWEHLRPSQSTPTLLQPLLQRASVSLKAWAPPPAPPTPSPFSLSSSCLGKASPLWFDEGVGELHLRDLCALVRGWERNFRHHSPSLSPPPSTSSLGPSEKQSNFARACHHRVFKPFLHSRGSDTPEGKSILSLLSCEGNIQNQCGHRTRCNPERVPAVSDCQSSC